eukprot:5363079-Ditylum_brightwellii.AAC.1
MDSILSVEKETFVMMRKLAMVVNVIRKGGSLIPNTTIQTIKTWDRSIQNSSRSLTRKTKAVPPFKLSTANFLLFSDKIVDQEDYKTKVEAQIRQTAFKLMLNAYSVITSSLKDDAENDIDPSGCTNLRLNGDNVDGFEYMNWHLMKYGELGRLTIQPATEVKWMTASVEAIEDSNFERVKQRLKKYLLKMDWDDKLMNVKEFTEIVESY